jgi:hypothetical protein
LSTGSAFWAVKNAPLAVDVHDFVVERLGGLLDRGELGPAGVDEQHVDSAEAILRAGEQFVEVCQVGHVGTDGQGIASDGGCGLRQGLLVPTADDDLGATATEFLGGGQADAARICRASSMSS